MATPFATSVHCPFPEKTRSLNHEQGDLEKNNVSGAIDTSLDMGDHVAHQASFCSKFKVGMMKLLPDLKDAFYNRYRRERPSDPFSETIHIKQGHVLNFIGTAFLSTIFGFGGFICTFLLHSTDASKYGSLVGLGIIILLKVYDLFVRFLTSVLENEIKLEAHLQCTPPQSICPTVTTITVASIIAVYLAAVLISALGSFLVLCPFCQYIDRRSWHHAVAAHNLNTSDAHKLWLSDFSWSARQVAKRRGFMKQLILKLGLLTEQEIQYIEASQKHKWDIENCADDKLALTIDSIYSVGVIGLDKTVEQIRGVSECGREVEKIDNSRAQMEERDRRLRQDLQAVLLI